MHGLYKLNAIKLQQYSIFFMQPINLLNTIRPKYGVIEEPENAQYQFYCPSYSRYSMYGKKIFFPTFYLNISLLN